MSAQTKIEWTDRTWNPVTGCTKVSPGCDNCYAENIARRFAGSKAFPDGFDVTLRPERLADPFRWRKPARVFVNSMSDLFHQDVPDDFIAQVFSVMAGTPQHTYQVLTKRHGRMRSLLSRPDFRFLATPPTSHSRMPDWPLPNVWLGVSVEDQKRADLRIPALLDTPAAVRFLSCEPLLGPVDLSTWVYGKTWPDTTRGAGGIGGQMVTVDPSPLDWVIVGGESGRGSRPMHPEWARRIRDDCRTAGVAFFFKQWGEWRPLAGDECAQVGDAWPEGTHGAMCRRVGKTFAGRELDGRTWDEFPEAAA